MLIQWMSDQIALSTVVIGWYMLVSMMIPKEKRSKCLNILIKSIIPVSTILLTLIVSGITALMEKGMGGWDGKVSEAAWGVPFRWACEILTDYVQWPLYIANAIWIVSVNYTIATIYIRQLNKESADMTPAQQEAKRKKGKFLVLILVVFAVDLLISFWYAGMYAHIIWDNPASRNSNPSGFHFALTGASYHSHQGTTTGECSWCSWRWFHYSMWSEINPRFPIQVVNSTLHPYDIPFLATQCPFLTDAAWPGSSPAVSGFDRGASYFGSWIVLLGNRMMHTFHAACVVLPAFVSVRNRYNALKKVKPTNKLVKGPQK